MGSKYQLSDNQDVRLNLRERNIIQEHIRHLYIMKIQRVKFALLKVRRKLL